MLYHLCEGAGLIYIGAWTACVCAPEEQGAGSVSSLAKARRPPRDHPRRRQLRHHRPPLHVQSRKGP
jgi:hypothetical protein